MGSVLHVEVYIVSYTACETVNVLPVITQFFPHCWVKKVFQRLRVTAGSLCSEPQVVRTQADDEPGYDLIFQGEGGVMSYMPP